jgi:hypothetical protein
MTNEGLSTQVKDLTVQVQDLVSAVKTLAETMNTKFKQIDERFEQIDKRFEQIDERFEQIDERFNQIDQRFESIDTQLSDIRSDHKNLTNIVRDMELRFERRFETLEAGQLTIRADITGLRHDIFIEEGSREEADETVFKEQKHNYESLDKRLRLVEAKFPDLAQKVATP